MQDPLKILLADAAAADRHTVRQALRQYYPDAIVQEAQTCLQAMEAIVSHRFDCVLLDCHLPDGSGISCLVDAREAGSTTPIIMLTDHGDEQTAVETIRAGATDYIPKSDLTARLLERCLRGALRYHQAQEEMRRVQEGLQLRDRAIAAASNGIVIADPRQPDCPLVYANEAFLRMSGYSEDEIIGHNCRFLQGADTDDRYIQQIRDCLREEKECQVVLRNYRKDGTAFWNELTVSPVRDMAGTLTHFIGVQTDITERREAEEALRMNVARQQTIIRDMFSSVTDGKLNLCASQDDLPESYTRFAEPVFVSRTNGIRELRRHALSACVAAGLPDERRYDLEAAVGEAAMNAVVHAGKGMGHVFLHERGTVQVCIQDEGQGITVEDLPNATLRRGYSSAGTMGHGFKMILKMVDRVFLLTGVGGTTVVVEQDRSAPAPAFL